MNSCCSGGAVKDDDDKEGECVERQDHPLLNHLILGRVFEHLRWKDLKDCRLVCKTWNVLTIPFTRKAFQVTISGSKSDSNQKHKIKNFVECFGSIQLEIPFTRFKLGSFCTTDGVGQQFLQLCGPTISAIEFIDMDIFMVEDILQLHKATPKLESFRLPNHLQSRSSNIVKLFPEDSNPGQPRLTSLKTLIVHFEFTEERDKFCPTFLGELITAAENIACLHLHDSRSEKRVRHSRRHDGVSSALQLLSLIEKLGRESAVQELKISQMKREEAELIELLHKMSSKPKGLKLKVFEYRARINSDQMIDHKLIPLASHYSDTLEKLVIDSPCLVLSSFVEFSKMLRLRSLSIHLSQDFNSRQVNFNHIFPVLEELVLSQKLSGQEYDEFFPESEPCLNLRSLEISSHHLKINGFNQILNVFPNLIKLKMTIKSDGVKILRQIWSQLTQLKYLNIQGTVETNDSLDSVLTGISTLDVQEIRDAVRHIQKRMTALERRNLISKLRDQQCRFHSIANLTDLRELRLDLRGEDVSVNRDRRTYLTEFTGYLGFYSMKRLKHLTVDQCELTKTCCEILTKDMGLQSWTFQTPELKSIVASRDN